jgi:hypothetical protein
MIRVSHFAAPAIVGAALLVGAGCSHEDRPESVSSNAMVLSEGHKSVSAVAPHDGTVSVWDDTANKIVYTGRVEKGDDVKVDAKNNRVLFKDKVAVERDLTDDHNYKIYFDRSSEADADVARHRQGATVIQSDNGSTVIQPRSDGATIVQPAPQPSNNTTIVQPPPAPAQQGTVYQPAPSNAGKTTVVRPDGTIERHD